MTTSAPDSGSSVRSVTRALQILTAIGNGVGSLSQIVDETGLAVATVHRLIETLRAQGFVRRDEVGTLALGASVVKLAYQVDIHGEYRMRIRNGITALCSRFNETVAFYMAEGLNRVCVESAESTQPVRVSIPVGTRVPIHLGAPGKVLLAFTDSDGILDSLSARGGQFPLADGRTRSVTALRRQLAQVRAARIATSSGEAMQGGWGVAAPVMGPFGLIGALSVAVPETRMTPTLQTDLTQACGDWAAITGEVHEAETTRDNDVVWPVSRQPA